MSTSTSNINDTSENSTEWQKAWKALRQHANKVTAKYPEEEWLPAMRNQAASLSLEFDVKDAELIEVLDQASKTGNDKYEYRPGVVWDIKPPTFILDTLIAEGRFHTIVAPAKLGKTTLALQFLSCLFNEQVQSYLNLLLNSNKKYSLYLIGPDMCQQGWNDALSACGLRDQHGQFGTPVKVIRPEECLDGLSSEAIRRYGEMAKQAKASGEEPIFLFDCYSTMADNTPSMKADEVSGLYYKPMRQLKNEMSRVGATTILLHHASKSSAKNGVVGSGAGNSKFSRIPDQLIDMKWIKEGDNQRQHGIELRAVGRLGEEVHKLIGPGESGRLEDIGDLAERKRQANLEEDMCKLTGDYSRALDFVGNCDEAGQGVTISAVANQMNWDRFKSRRVLKYLERRDLIYKAGDTGEGARPAGLYRYWESKPTDPCAAAQALNERVHERPPCAGAEPLQTLDGAGWAGSGTRTEAAWLSHEPGTRVELKLTDGTWEEGWIVKSCNKTTGEHEAWKYPDLSRTKCKLRAGIEMRETVVIDYEEAL